ncbi:hypothetical protein NP590_11920 [Methylomonas sp. SURF-2]|uniref:Uncharacterized protein n=1 Tax=Methylomonas subterranea TaxID=2952225 RepID=A0ABT1TH76_9GAMM|nr:hypothetical protein [Methylomonas sp. SURF-2]MCQ8104816.1 hypothetical protein [Methylomonas sp. SURF-2]
MKSTTPILLSVWFAMLGGIVPVDTAVAAATPAERDSLRLHAGMPKKAGDSLFSYTLEWRLDDEELYRVTGMSFLNPDKIDGEASPGRIAKKLVTAVKDGMIQLDPRWRGVSVTQPGDEPELDIANKAGYALTSAVFRDYSNQAMGFDLRGKNFNAAGVQLAIDLVYAADVDYLDGFTARKAQTASTGNIEIRIDQQEPMRIKTDGKTSKELEAEIAAQLMQAQLSETTLVPHIINKDKRNNKPFDGSEVQLSNLAAKSLHIEVSDPSLGVLVKFKFKDENRSVKVAEPRFMMAALAVLVGGGLFYFWRGSRKKSA